MSLVEMSCNGYPASSATRVSTSLSIEGQHSTHAPVTSGVPQGSVLGPQLFLNFIIDMPEKTSSTCRLFADDSFLYKMIRNQQDAQALQQDLTNVQEREKTWKMSFNPSNCEVIGITRKRAPVNTTYLIHDHPLCSIWMKQGKYHGVILSDKLSWTPHIEIWSPKRRTTHWLFSVETFPDVQEMSMPSTRIHDPILPNRHLHPT